MDGAAIFADKLAFQPNSDYLFRVLHHLKSTYRGVTCNTVAELLTERNVIWEMRYFGITTLYGVVQGLNANGVFVLYKNLWEFKDKQIVLRNEEEIDEDTGGMENVSVAFQLYLIFTAVSIIGFGVEYVWIKWWFRIKSLDDRTKVVIQCLYQISYDLISRMSTINLNVYWQNLVSSTLKKISEACKCV